jgi:hypothetical protein
MEEGEAAGGAGSSRVYPLVIAAKVLGGYGGGHSGITAGAGAGEGRTPGGGGVKDAKEESPYLIITVLQVFFCSWW